MSFSVGDRVSVFGHGEAEIIRVWVHKARVRYLANGIEDNYPITALKLIRDTLFDVDRYGSKPKRIERDWEYENQECDDQELGDNSPPNPSPSQELGDNLPLTDEPPKTELGDNLPLLFDLSPYSGNEMIGACDYENQDYDHIDPPSQELGDNSPPNLSPNQELGDNLPLTDEPPRTELGDLSSPNPSPNPSPNQDLNLSPNSSPNQDLNLSPNPSPNLSPNSSPNQDLNLSPNPSPIQVGNNVRFRGELATIERIWINEDKGLAKIRYFDGSEGVVSIDDLSHSQELGDNLPLTDEPPRTELGDNLPLTDNWPVTGLQGLSRPAQVRWLIRALIDDGDILSPTDLFPLFQQWGEVQLIGSLKVLEGIVRSKGIVTPTDSDQGNCQELGDNSLPNPYWLFQDLININPLDLLPVFREWNSFQINDAVNLLSGLRESDATDSDQGSCEESIDSVYPQWIEGKRIKGKGPYYYLRERNGITRSKYLGKVIPDDLAHLPVYHE